jgi:hypothetical protein
MSMNEEEPIAPVETDGTDLARVRDLILAAHADVVPELIAGATIQALIDSVEPARGAYQSVIARMAPPAPPVVPVVPAGSALAAVDPSTLPAHELIRRGLRAARK